MTEVSLVASLLITSLLWILFTHYHGVSSLFGIATRLGVLQGPANYLAPSENLLESAHLCNALIWLQELDLPLEVLYVIPVDLMYLDVKIY